MFQPEIGIVKGALVFTEDRTLRVDRVRNGIANLRVMAPERFAGQQFSISIDQITERAPIGSAKIEQIIPPGPVIAQIIK